MRTVGLLAFFLAVMAGAVVIGLQLQNQAALAAPPVVIPSIGRIQILNACGLDGAGGKMADFLRRHNFDVKIIGNAPTSNFSQTMVVSRQNDMRCARQVGEVLQCQKIILLRTGDESYDVTVFVGADFEERIR